MTRYSPKEIEKLLEAEPHGPVDPPAELLDRLLADIPDTLPVPADPISDSPTDGDDPEPGLDDGIDPDGDEAEVVPFRRHRVYALAALVLVALGAALIAPRIFRQASLVQAPVNEAQANAPVASAERMDEAGMDRAASTEPVDEDIAFGRAEAESAEATTKEDARDGAMARQALLGQVSAKEPAAPAPFADAPAEPPAEDLPTAQSGEIPEVAEEIVVTAEAPALERQSFSASLSAADAAGSGGERAERAEADDANDFRVGSPRIAPAPPPPPPPAPPASLGTAVAKARAKKLAPPMLREIAPDERKARERELPESAAARARVRAPNPVLDDMFFESVDTNPFVDTEDDALSTFALDVDTGSYGLVRRYLEEGHLPPRQAVRPEELINYFDYQDPAPASETDGNAQEDFALHAHGAPSIYGEGERYYLLRVGLKGREVKAEDRPAALLSFVIDTSGSMAQGARLQLVREALELLVDQLRDDDRVGLVSYGSDARIVMEPTADKERLRRAIRSLNPGGSTNAEAGLRLGYEMAARHRRPGQIQRVILCSDGVANVGTTTARGLLEKVRSHAEKGIELTSVGVGMGNYNDALLEQLADNGNGRYAYVDDLPEARRLFVSNLTGTLQTLAADARAQVEFDPGVVSRYRLVGYENRDLADHRFRDDSADAGEIGAGHTVTAVYELKTHRDLRQRDRVATVRLRYGSVAQGKVVEQSLEVTGEHFARSFERAHRSLKLAALVAEFGEILRGSYWAREGDPNDVFQRLQKVAADYPGDVEIAELASLAGRAARLLEEAEP